MASHARLPGIDGNARRAGIALVLALHVAVLAVLLAAAPVRRAAERSAPVVVRLIASQVDSPPIQPPKPLPVDARAHSPRPVAAPLAPAVPRPEIATAHDAPAIHVQTTTEVPAAQPAPPAIASPLPSAQSVAAVAPITPPDFRAAYLDNPPPPYPPIARRSGEQGRVLLRVLVTPSGSAETVELRTSSGSQRLDHAAVETVKRWRFVPARRGTEPIAAWVLVPIQFTLDT